MPDTPDLGGEHPELDEAPVTLGIIEQLIEAHPEYRKIGHTGPNGNRFFMVEIPDSGEYHAGAPGDFVAMVANLDANGGDDADDADRKQLFEDHMAGYHEHRDAEECPVCEIDESEGGDD